MTAYLVAIATVTDPVAWAAYAARTPAVMAQFGGRLRVRATPPETLEGQPFDQRLVVVEFPSLDQARGFFQSEAYQAVRALRLAAGSIQILVSDGVTEEDWTGLRTRSEALPPLEP